MARVTFQFEKTDEWTMGPACKNPSMNPAPSTHACIYMIHNANENTTYVGYADDAQHRWKGRTEVFHIMGIPKAYAKNILCACCIPKVSGNQHNQIMIKGLNNCEHLLVRAVANGLLGKTTSTNTQLGSVQFHHNAVTAVRVYLPSSPLKWGSLESDKETNVGNWY